jgi:hypothetical protein
MQARAAYVTQPRDFVARKDIQAAGRRDARIYGCGLAGLINLRVIHSNHSPGHFAMSQTDKRHACGRLASRFRGEMVNLCRSPRLDFHKKTPRGKPWGVFVLLHVMQPVDPNHNCGPDPQVA